jgi:hypothetical protein
MSLGHDRRISPTTLVEHRARIAETVQQEAPMHVQYARLGVSDLHGMYYRGCLRKMRRLTNQAFANRSRVP